MFSRQSVTDRFYRALYSKIQEAYTQAQIKQVWIHWVKLPKAIPYFARSILVVVFFIKVRNGYQESGSSCLHDKIAPHRPPTQAAFLNVLYKALSVDPSANRIRAFVKRLLQLAMGQNPPFACATLYLVSELSKVKPVIFSMVTQPEGDDEERFVDASDSDAEPANGTSQCWDLWPISCCLFPHHAASRIGFGHQPFTNSNFFIPY
jgi:hypothetical protein